MGKDSEDKAERVLSIYTRLKQGKVINKEKESIEYHVAPRTIQRDIADIQCFLENQGAETGVVQEVVYDKKFGGYILQTKQKNQLEGKEILAILKVLLESRSLMKIELFPIIQKILGLCSDEEDAKNVEMMLKNEMYHYVELQHGQKLLDRLWELEQVVKEQRYIEIQYQRPKNKEIVTRKVKPVGIMFSEFYYYLTAYIEDINKEGRFQNPADTYPTIYRVDRIRSLIILDEHFHVPYTERFEVGEFRKRIQFMYGGRLKKVKLKCQKQCVEAVLDRLPTAEIIKKEKDSYVVLAETFGDGIDKWVMSQGNNIIFC